MKAFIIAALFVASCSAHLYGAISTQYQAQDGLGGYSYGYSDPLSTKNEVKSHDGTLHGGYSYVDANGHVQSVKYVADSHNGFRVVAATNLPQAPVHVVAAPVAHIAPVAYHVAAPVEHWGHHAYAPLALAGPSKTPEVLHAEAKHFQAHAEANARLHSIHKRSAHWAPQVYSIAPAPIHGVPQDEPAVAALKAQRIAELNEKSGHAYYAPAAPAYNHYAHEPAHYYAAPAKHFVAAPLPVHGVPQDEPAVAQLKAQRIAELSAKSGHAYAPAAVHYSPSAHASYVPVDTPEVQHAKAFHLAKLAEAKSGSHGYYAHEDDGSYDSARYEKDNYYH